MGDFTNHFTGAIERQQTASALMVSASALMVSASALIDGITQLRSARTATHLLNIPQACSCLLAS